MYNFLPTYLHVHDILEDLLFMNQQSPVVWTQMEPLYCLSPPLPSPLLPLHQPLRWWDVEDEDQTGNVSRTAQDLVQPGKVEGRETRKREGR